MLYVAAKAQGVPTIEEGRIFLINEDSWREGSLIPEGGELEGYVTSKSGEAVEVRLAGEKMPAVCPTCSALLERRLLCHTYAWMEIIFSCPNHSEVVWLDICPKADGPGTEHDWTNVLPKFVDRDKRIEIDAQRIQWEGVVTPLITSRDMYKEHVKIAPVKYLLTLRGLELIVEKLPEKAQPRLSWFRNPFRWGA